MTKLKTKLWRIYQDLAKTQSAEDELNFMKANGFLDVLKQWYERLEEAVNEANKKQPIISVQNRLKDISTEELKEAMDNENANKLKNLLIVKFNRYSFKFDSLSFFSYGVVARFAFYHDETDLVALPTDPPVSDPGEEGDGDDHYLKDFPRSLFFIWPDRKVKKGLAEKADVNAKNFWYCVIRFIIEKEMQHT